MKKYGVIKHWTLSADFAIDMSNELRIFTFIFPNTSMVPLKNLHPFTFKAPFLP
jgi:hypothetical protein